MAEPESKKEKSTRRGGLNIRFILLGVFILFIVLVLAGLAAVNLFLGDDGDNGGSTEQQTQEVPVEGGVDEQPTETPTATDAPTVTPSPTLTPTNTPFQLPTPEPTDLPTPTSTPVVPPTPGG